MIETDCPYCKESNKYQIATGSDRIKSVHKSKEETESTKGNIALHSKKLDCQHCEKTFYVVMLDQRW